MSDRTAVVTFFSGTGNTRRACRLLADGLARGGWRVGLREIAPPRSAGDAAERPAGSGAPPPAGQPDLAVFAFPVFAFGMPHLVRRFVRRLPRVDGVSAAVLAVFGDAFSGPPSARRRASGFEGAALDEAVRLLSRRGYAVRTARGTGFPVSFTQFLQPPGDEERRTLLEGSEKAVAAIASDLAAGRHELLRRGPGTRAWTGAVRAAFSLAGRRVLGKLYAADGRCTSCGWCERACPAATIRMRGPGRTQKLPRWGWRCEACQRCINGCPEAAVQVSLLRIAAFAAVAFLPYGRWLAEAAPSHRFPGAGLLAWVAGTMLGTVAVDQLVRLVERVPGIRRLVGMGYTKRFRRYPAPR